jgi:hypothetical protein
MKKLLLAALAVAGAVVVTALGVVTAGAGAASPDGLQAVQAAASRYHSIVQARQDGYTTENEPCVSAPPPPGSTGAMGIHAVNGALIGDGVVDPLRPEILLYLPKANGELELVGVEYFAIALANTETGPAPWFGAEPPPLGFFTPSPSVLGRTFDGPMPGHNPTMPWHYDLHVWLWADNPAGLFAPFNPALTC